MKFCIVVIFLFCLSGICWADVPPCQTDGDMDGDGVLDSEDADETDDCRDGGDCATGEGDGIPDCHE